MRSRWYFALPLLITLVTPSFGAKPVLLVWQEHKGGRVVLVTPRSDAEIGWLTQGLKNVPYRTAKPAEFAIAVPKLQKGDLAVVYLFERSQADQWPAETLAKFPKPHHTVAADEALVCYKNVGYFCFALIVPDEQELRRTWPELLITDAQKCIDAPDSMISYKLRRALAVGEQQDLLRNWLTGEEDASNRYRTKFVKPAELRAEDFEQQEALVVGLTWRELREQVPDEARQALLAVLPEPLTRAAAGQEDTLILTSTAWRRPGLLGGAVLAPTERFLEVCLQRDAKKAMVSEALRRIVLTSAKSPGGQCNLLDFRGVRGMALVSDAVVADHRDESENVAAKIKAGLGDQCSLRFVDDRVLSDALRRALRDKAGGGQIPPDLMARLTANQVDLWGRVWLTNVIRQTSYTVGTPVCVTSDPGPFDKRKPDKPDPNAKCGPPWKQRPCYPEGENDPAYKRDLNQYYEDIRQWEKEKRERDDYRANADVAWERYLTEEQKAVVDGQLELFDQTGKQLLSVRITGEGTDATTSTHPFTVRGFNALPPALTTPAPKSTAAEILVARAIEMAAGRIPPTLRLACLTPADAGLAPPPPAPVVVGPPPATGKVVVVEGVGALAEGAEVARQKARASACRAALEQEVGVYVEARTLVQKAQLIEDRIYTRTDGFAAVRQELSEQVDGEVLRLRCEVEIQHRPLREALVAAGVTRQWRVMIAVPENLPGSTGASQTVDTWLSKRIAQAGLPVIDLSQSLRVRERQAELTRLEGNRELAEQLRQQFNAEIIVTGEAAVEATGRELDQETASATIQVRAIDLNTAEVLAADEQAANALDRTVVQAGRAALGKAAEQVSDEVLDALFRRIGPTTERLELKVRGFDRGITPLDRFEQTLRGWPSTERIQRIEFNGGLATLEVEIARGLKQELEKWLESPDLDREFRLQVTASPGATIEARLTWNIDEVALQTAREAAQRAALAVELAVREATARQQDATAARLAAAAAEPAPAALHVTAAETAAGRAETAVQATVKAREELQLAFTAALQATNQNADHAAIKAIQDAIRTAATAAEQAGQAALQAREEATEAARELRRRPVEIASPAPPVVVEGVLLVPVKPVLDWLGATSEWHAATRTLVISLSIAGRERKVTLVLGAPVAYVDGSPVTVTPPPQVRAGAMVAPGPLVAEAFGLTLELDRAADVVRLTDGERVGLLKMR